MRLKNFNKENPNTKSPPVSLIDCPTNQGKLFTGGVKSWQIHMISKSSAVNLQDFGTQKQVFIFYPIFIINTTNTSSLREMNNVLFWCGMKQNPDLASPTQHTTTRAGWWHFLAGGPSTVMAPKLLGYCFVVFLYVITQMYIMQVTRKFFVVTQHTVDFPGQEAMTSCDKDCVLIGQDYQGDSGSFQRAGENTYVYSAYYDRRIPGDPVVRIIGVSSLNATLYCHLWFEKGTHTASSTPLVIKAHLYVPVKHFRSSGFHACTQSILNHVI